MADDMLDVLGSLGLDISPFLNNLAQAEQAMQASVQRMTAMGAGLTLGGGLTQGQLPDYTPQIQQTQALTEATGSLIGIYQTASAVAPVLAAALTSVGSAGTTAAAGTQASTSAQTAATSATQTYIASLRQETDALNALMAVMRSEAAIGGLQASIATDAGPQIAATRAQLDALQQLTEARRADAAEAVAAAEVEQTALATLVQNYTSAQAGMSAEAQQRFQAEITAQQAATNLAIQNAQAEVAAFQSAKAQEAQLAQQAEQQATQAAAAQAQQYAAVGTIARQLTGDLQQLGVPLGGITRSFDQGAQVAKALTGETNNLAAATALLEQPELAAAAAAVVVVSAVLQMTQAYVAYADQIRNAALITGASQLEVQGLTAALSAQGIASSQVTTALTLMDQRGQQLFDQMETGQAVTGRMANALHELGISAVAFATADTDQRVNLIADALQRAGNDTQTTAAAVELLGGRFGRTLVPALSDGEAGIERWRQATVSANASVEDSQGPVLQWHAALTELNLTWQGLEQTVGSVALPLLIAGVEVFRLFLEVVSASLMPLRLVAAAIEGVGAGLGKLKDAWGAVPGPIRGAVEETLKFASPVTALPELAGKATQSLTSLAEGHGLAGNAAKDHGQKEQESAQQITQALALSRGAYSDLAPDQSLVLLDDAVAKLGKTQQGTTLLTQVMAAELAHAGQAATDEATLTSQMGAAALAAGIPISEVSRIMQLLNGVVQENGTDFLQAAIAQDQATQAAIRNAQADRELASALDSVSQEAAKFSTDMAALGGTSGDAFRSAFGSQIQGLSQGLNSEAASAFNTWQQLAGKVVADQQNLDTLKKQMASQSAIDTAQAQLSGDQTALQSAQRTAQEKIGFAKDYVAAVESSAGEITSVEQQRVATQRQIDQLGTNSSADAVRARLVAVQSLQRDLIGLEQQRQTTTSAVDRSILDVAIAADKQRLTSAQNTAAEQVRIEGAAASQQSQISAYDDLKAAIDREGQSLEQQAITEAQVSTARQFAKETADQQRQTLETLQGQIDNSTGSLKTYLQQQQALDLDFQTLTPAVAEAVIAHQQLADAFGFSHDKVVDLNAELPQLVQALHDGTINAQEFGQALLDLTSKPTQEELNLKAQLADITAQLAGVNSELANSSPMEQHIAELQKKIRTDQETGVSLEQLQKDQADLNTQLGHASQSAGEQGVALGNLQFELGNTQKATQAQLTAEQSKRQSYNDTTAAVNAMRDGTAISMDQLTGIMQQAASGQINAMQGVAVKAGPAGKAAGDANTQQMSQSMTTGLSNLNDTLAQLPAKLAEALTDPRKFQDAATKNIGDSSNGFVGGIYAGDPTVADAGTHMGNTFGDALNNALGAAMLKAARNVIAGGAVIAGLASAAGTPGSRNTSGAGINLGYGSEGFLYPTEGPITQGFGQNGEHGIDIGVDAGTPLAAGINGRIVEVKAPSPEQAAAGLGYWITIDAGNGLQEVIGHMDAIAVQQGDMVARGQVVGVSGGEFQPGHEDTSISSGPHTEVQVLINGGLVNPETVLGKILQTPDGGTVNATVNTGTLFGGAQGLLGNLGQAFAGPQGLALLAQLFSGGGGGTPVPGHLLTAEEYAAIQAHESTLPLPSEGAPMPMFGLTNGAAGSFAVDQQVFTSGGTAASSESMGLPPGYTNADLLPSVDAGESAFDALAQQIAPAAVAYLQATGDFIGFIQQLAPAYAGIGEAPGFASGVIANYQSGVDASGFSGASVGPNGEELPYNAESAAGQSMQTRDLGQANAAVTAAQNQIDQLQQRLDDIVGTGIPAAYQQQEDAAGQAAVAAIDAQNLVLAAAIQVQTDIANGADDATLKQDTDALNSAKTQASADDQTANSKVAAWNKIVSAVTAGNNAITQDTEKSNAALSTLAQHNADVAAGQADYPTKIGAAYQGAADTALQAWIQVGLDMDALQNAMTAGADANTIKSLNTTLTSDTQRADSADKASNAAFAAWDKEYKAEAQARKDLDAAIRQDVADETNLIAGLATSYTKFATAVSETGRVMGPGWAAGSAVIVQSSHSSAVAAEQAYHNAAQQVIQDEGLLTSDLTEQDRIRLTDKLNTDKDIAASAKQSAQDQEKAFAAVADAFAQMNANIQQATKDRLGMDASGFNDFTNKQLASIGLVADKQTTYDQARISDARSTYDAVAADSQIASQKLIKDQSDYNAAVAAGNAVEAGRLEAAVSADQSRIAADQQAAQAIVQQYGTIQQAAETDAKAEMQAAKDAITARIKGLESARDAALQSISDQEKALDAASQKAIQDYTDQANAQKQAMQDAAKAAMQAFDDEAAARKQALSDSTQSQKDAVDAQTQAQIDAIQAQLDQEQQAKDTQHLADLQAAVDGATTADARKTAQQQLSDFQLQLHDKDLQDQIKDLQAQGAAQKKALDEQAKQQQQADDQRTAAQKQAMTDQATAAQQAFSDQTKAHLQAMTDQTKQQKTALEQQAAAVKNYYNDPQNGLIAVQQRAITEIDRAMSAHYTKQEGDAAASARQMLATAKQSPQDQIAALTAAAPGFFAAGQTDYGAPNGYVGGANAGLTAAGLPPLSGATASSAGGGSAVGGSLTAVSSPWFGTMANLLTQIHGDLTIGPGIKVQIVNPAIGPATTAASPGVSIGSLTVHAPVSVTTSGGGGGDLQATVKQAVSQALDEAVRESVRYGVNVPR